MKILVSDGVADTDANLLLEDVSVPSFQATLTRRDASVHKIIGGKKKEETHPNVLILLKSPKRSWMFQFYSAGEGDGHRHRPGGVTKSFGRLDWLKIFIFR